MSNHIKTETSSRVPSIDALRGFIMLAMIFVNDLAIIQGDIVPDWMLHFSDRAKGSGMTFVDLVFPAFIFIVGMSIPFSIESSKRKGKTSFQIVLHVLTRTFFLLFLGVIMVNGWPNSANMGWSAPLWQTLMGLCAILAFCQISTPNMSSSAKKRWAAVTPIIRTISFVGLIVLAFQFVGKHGNHIITLSPLHIYPSWWGILGTIGWAYLIASIIYLIFQTNRTAILTCMSLLLCLFPATIIGVLRGSWLGGYINIGATLGSEPSIAVAGMLLSTILITPNTQTVHERIRFTALFIMAMSLGAILLNGLYGISKNSATPTWALWACAITASLWLFFYLIYDMKPFRLVSRLLTMAGGNVLLAYLLSAIYFSIMINIGMGDWYRSFGQVDLTHAILRAFSISIFLLFCSVMLNRIGFRLKL